ncbi:MAG: hypothetical protein NTX87_01875 [Planctomycetota bacterium]|nr:hypothetical protein [Planctomycetota bacterium]
MALRGLKVITIAMGAAAAVAALAVLGQWLLGPVVRPSRVTGRNDTGAALLEVRVKFSIADREAEYAVGDLAPGEARAGEIRHDFDDASVTLSYQSGGIDVVRETYGCIGPHGQHMTVTVKPDGLDVTYGSPPE